VLVKAGYETPIQLIAEYFKVDRDQEKFKEKLVEIGIDAKFAATAAENIHLKLGPSAL